MFRDGTAYALTKPTITFSGLPPEPRRLLGSTREAADRDGLLEAIPEADLWPHADPQPIATRMAS